MLITQKKQYALRAIFELAKQQGEEPVKTSIIAEAQAIPLRFLEVIMGQMKRAGVVASKRGFFGGYTLVDPPEQIRVGDIFRALDKVEKAEVCMSCASKGNCPFLGNCVFMGLWDQAQLAVNSVYDQMTIQALIDQENMMTGTEN
ncbi:AsnC family transcriptional regulator [Desulfosarcina alkanivorans]|uniref:AsnC family transcriptional regulator n=1 Tax=Desulfosarcina alkanivorans TaxID=571177 RepID=A0A5K7YKI5_9BACT|nr:Rrf2 family transcriptional regulator [Desulfosarcina alkanivorans]BBO69338.1 AsnC family transcriptional regulator [Desulfosarcina alkanivorans]